jgi:hypothetical protein
MGTRAATFVAALGPGLVLWAVSVTAGADQSEWRLGVAGGAVLTTATLAAAPGTGLGFGVRGRIGYGLSDSVELGGIVSYTDAEDICFEHAAMLGQAGTLYANLSTIAAGAELRWTPGVGVARAFARTGPYLAARGGATLVITSGQQLFAPNNLLILDADDALDVRAFGAAAIGLEHRFGDHLFVAAEIAATFMADARRIDSTFELAWSWY